MYTYAVKLIQGCRYRFRLEFRSSMQLQIVFPVFALILSSIPIGSLKAQNNTVTVSVIAVDATYPSITVTYDGKSRSLELAKDLTVEIDGKISEYRSLLPGDDAEITYDKGRAIVTRIVVQRRPLLPADKMPEGWDEIDQRLVFLMVRLANVEGSLEAVENVLDGKNAQVNSKLRNARRADRENEELDRKGGGPLKWSVFYGMTAEKFFYHPTDRNTKYHTETVLGQQGSQADNKVGGGVPSSQGLPVHQRPPQFDYIYRANENARDRAEAEASSLKNKLDQLAVRRRNLEIEQAGLWVEIAFRAISHYDLDKKPAYRFDPLMLASDTDFRRRMDTIRVTSSFMGLVLSIIAEADKDQAGTFTRIKPAVAKARREMNDTLLRLAIDSSDKRSSVGRFVSLAKRIDDIAANLTDSYVVSMEGDSAKDSDRKETFRAQLQLSLINYAQIVLALDEMSSEMVYEYGYKPDVNKRIEYVTLSNIDPVTQPSSLAQIDRGASRSDAATESLSLAGKGKKFSNELLSKVDIKNQLVHGPVTKVRSGFYFVIPKGQTQWPRIQIPTGVKEDESYELRCDFTIIRGGLGIVLPISERQVCLMLNSFQDGATIGFQMVRDKLGDVNETSVRGRKLSENDKHTLVIRVRQMESNVDITVAIDEKPITSYRGSRHDLRALPEVQLSNRKMLGLVGIGEIVFHACSIAPLESIPIGIFNVHWTQDDGVQGEVKYEFKEDGSVFKESKLIGKASEMAGVVRIIFLDSKRGSVLLKLESPDVFKGTHTWSDGRISIWQATRMKSQ